MTAWAVTAAAREVPDRVALITDREVLTYQQLAERVRGSAAGLAEAGVGPAVIDDGRRVMMVAPNSVDCVCAVLALIEIGAPIMLLHPRSTPAERASLRAAYPPAVFLDGPPAPSTSLFAPENERLFDGSLLPAEAPAISPERDLAVFFTSGTTGRPKAVRLSRRAFAASAAASAKNLGWNDEDRWLLSIPMAHVGGFSILTRCLLARRTVVLVDGPAESERLRFRAERDRVTLMSLVPTQLKRWLPAGPGPHVRAVLLGGAPAAAGLRAAARAAGWPILATYGLTEACSQVAVQPYEGRRSPAREVVGGPSAPSGGDEDSGRPLAGTELSIREGRIWIRGPTLLSGYVSPSDGDAPAAPLDPDGWFDTGDLGRVDEHGRLVVDARRADLILSGGENVYPREVESALQSVPGVRDAVVFGIENTEWGQIVAAALEADDDLVVADVDEAIRRILAGPKRPRRWAVLSRFPLTPSGKIDRRQVVRLAHHQLGRLG